jgi:hypothetical protein
MYRRYCTSADGGEWNSRDQDVKVVFSLDSWVDGEISPSSL